jgi:hypothetical protein
MLTAVLGMRPIMGDLTHGNVNIFILFLMISSLSAFSRGRDLLAGVLLALAIACKVTPALFIGYFLWKRAWRVLGGCGMGLVAFFFIIPAICLGWGHNLRALTSWIDVMILPYVVGKHVTSEHINQSLPGFIARMLTSAPSYSTYIGNDYFMGAFALLVVLTCRSPIAQPGMTKAEARRGWRLAAEYSLIFIGMLLFSERTWKHHCVTMLLPYAVLCYGLASVNWSLSSRRFIGLATVTATALMLSTSTGLYAENLSRVQENVEATSLVIGPAATAAATQAGVLTDSLAKRAQVYGAYIWGFALLIAGLVVQIRYSRVAVATPAMGGWKLPAFEVLYPTGARTASVDAEEMPPKTVKAPRKRRKRRTA